jgi:hypothetical protein
MNSTHPLGAPHPQTPSGHPVDPHHPQQIAHEPAIVDPLLGNLKKHTDSGDSALELEEMDGDAGDQSHGVSKIRAFGVGGEHIGLSEFKRQTNNTGQGASRVRSFHGRLSDQGLGFLDDSVNAWLDSHPDVDVKFVTSTIGLYDGKIKEPALILNVWY